MFNKIKITKIFFRNIIIVTFAIAIFYINTSYFNKHKTSLYLEKEILTTEMKSSIQKTILKNNNKLIINVYKDINYNPLWTKNYELTPIAKDFLHLLKNHKYYGIPNSSEYEYLISLSKKIKTSKSKEDLIDNRLQFEIETTHRFINFLNFLIYGINQNQNILLEKELYPIILHSLKNNKIINLPEYLFYKKNKNIYNLQRAIKNFLDNLKIDTTKIFLITNDKEKIKNDIITYFKKTYGYNHINDSMFTELLIKYQKYTGLEETGELDKKTIRLFKNSTYYLYCKMILNFERYKTFTPTDSFYIWINIPSYNLKVIKNDTIIKEFRIIVGKKETPTPLFTSYIDKIIINPEWVVPPSIIEKEIINLIKKDKTYLIKNKFYVKNISDTIDLYELLKKNSNIKLTQKAGDKNALGRLKFCINNPYQIYIHDTPSKHLFKNETRAYSHGCIRIEKAEDFAQILIDYCKIDNINLKEFISNDNTKVIYLTKFIPVYITYFTCYADKNGNLSFYEDIYNYDDENITAIQNNQLNFNTTN